MLCSVKKNDKLLIQESYTAKHINCVSSMCSRNKMIKIALSLCPNSSRNINYLTLPQSSGKELDKILKLGARRVEPL